MVRPWRSPGRAPPTQQNRTSSLRAAVAAAARRLDAEPLTGIQLTDRLGAELLAVEQIAPARAGLAAVSAGRRMAPSLGDERIVQGRQRLDLAHHAVAASEATRAARVAAQRVLHHPHRE